MNITIRTFGGGCLLAAIAALPGLARADALSEAAGNYRIEPSSSIKFKVDQVGGGGIKGDFSRFSGSFKIDGKNVSGSAVSFTLDPGSVRTGEPRIEAFLKSDAVFDVENHPEIRFRSNTVNRVGENDARIDGKLTARGIARNAHFDVRVQDRNGRRIAFHVTGSIYRAPYGMDVGVPIYSNIVQFDMMLTGTRK